MTTACVYMRVEIDLFNVSISQQIFIDHHQSTRGSFSYFCCGAENTISALCGLRFSKGYRQQANK